MNIGIDLDEILADFLNHFLLFHNETYGSFWKKEQFSYYDIWKVLGETKEETMKKVYAFYDSSYFENIKPIQGAIGGVNSLKKNNELMVVTARQFEFKEKTEKWLDKYFPQKFKKINFANHHSLSGISRKKSEVCLQENVSILIDDSLEYATDCADAGMNVILFDRPWNQAEKLPEKISRVYSWKEAIENIKDI